MFLGRIIVFPIPGFDHPPLANSTGTESKTSAFSYLTQVPDESFKLGILVGKLELSGFLSFILICLHRNSTILFRR